MISIGQFLIGTAVSLTTLFVLLFYDATVKSLDGELKRYALLQEKRSFQRLDQTPVAFRYSVKLEPYGATRPRSSSRLVTFNYAFQNVGLDNLIIQQVVIRSFLHKAIPVTEKQLAAQVPKLDSDGCLGTHGAWTEYARPETYRYDVNEDMKISVAGMPYTARKGGGGIAELDPKAVSGGSAMYLVSVADDDFLGFLICVDYEQSPPENSRNRKVHPWGNSIVLRAKNGGWSSEATKD